MEPASQALDLTPLPLIVRQDHKLLLLKSGISWFRKKVMVVRPQSGPLSNEPSARGAIQYSRRRAENKPNGRERLEWVESRLPGFRWLQQFHAVAVRYCALSLETWNDIRHSSSESSKLTW